MSPKRLLLVAVCVSLLFSLAACLPAQSTDDSGATFYVSIFPHPYTPQGSGWKPNSKVEISIWGEPDGPGSASTQWKTIFVENGDDKGFFGFDDSAPLYPPPLQKFCGSPEVGQTIVFMAKSLTTGRIKMWQAPADLYFTYKPCP